ncbi:DUF4240 domain-containing protein [Kitasatospora brasiliensis]|uniref:DUF4240 domain-containing protein n=1 Tax=Kitasatospora brasiliensis TaxID=3058040 RepID=UPI00292EC430|nr:DUF4240 domain-containing protein [Kitasatospora sp. K002]
MDTPQFWQLIDEARSQVPAPDDGGDVARRAAALLALRPVEEIIATEQTIWKLLADSRRAPLWGAAYLINGGCSDDGFDYFRGWLITQGRATFESVIADPDRLAALPAVRAFAADGIDIECEEALAIVWHAHRTATGQDLPDVAARTVQDPPLDVPLDAPLDSPLDPDWNFDFDDTDELNRRLPRLAALYAN